MSNKPVNYNISELSKEFQITTRTIRHYEEIGLLAPKRKGQTRIYSPADRTKLLLILRGKRVGFTLKESRDIVEMYDPVGSNTEQLLKLAEQIQDRRSRLVEQQKDLLAMMEDLDRIEAGCHKALKKQSTH